MYFSFLDDLGTFPFHVHLKARKELPKFATPDFKKNRTRDIQWEIGSKEKNQEGKKEAFWGSSIDSNNQWHSKQIEM